MKFTILDGQKYRETFDRWADLSDGAKVQVATNPSTGVRLAFVDQSSSAHHYLTPEQAAAIAAELLAAACAAQTASREAA